MDDPIRPSRDALLESQDLSERVELARQLGNQPADPQLAEKRLLRAFAKEIPEELRKEVELSLLKLRDGVEEDLGNKVLDAEVHWGIYQDALKLNPSEDVLWTMMKQAASWSDSNTATRLANQILIQSPGSWLCGKALGVLAEHDEIDPDWYLEYFSTYCAREFDDIDDAHLVPLLDSIDALGDRLGWDARRRRDEAMSRIRPALKKIEAYSGPKEVLDWLTRCGPAEGLLELYNEFLDEPEIASDVLPYLGKLGEEARPTLIKVLEGRVDHQDNRITREAVEPALQAGLSVAEILRALALNPDSREVGEALHHLTRLNEARVAAELKNLGQAERSFLRDCLALHLSDYVLRDLSHFARHYYGRHEWEYLFRGFQDVYDLRRFISRLESVWGRSGARLMLKEAGGTAHQLSLIRKLFGPGDEMNFGLLTGVTLTEPLSFEYDDTLRFEYLMEYGLTANERPLRPLISDLSREERHERLVESPERLVALERERDRTLDKLAYLRSELEAAQRAEAEREERLDELNENEWRETGRREIEILRAELRESPRLSLLEEQIRELERRLSGGYFDPLHDASNNLTRALSETGVTFERWEPEGLLGEFRPPNRTATIYTGMIRLLAASPVMKRLGSADKVEGALRRIAEIHEAMHGQIILAHTCDGQTWQPYEQSPYCLHEALATAYTRRFVESLGDNRLLLSVLDALESLLPAEYQGSSFLGSLSGEGLRAFLLDARRSKTAGSIAQAANEVLSIVRSEAGLLAVMLEEEAYERLRSIIAEVSEELQRAGDAAELVQACRTFFRRIEDEAAEAIPLVETLGELEWPGEVRMAYWQVLESCHAGEVGGDSLRLRVEWIGRAPGLSTIAGYEDLQNSASLGLPNFEAAAEAAGLSPDDPAFRLLKERMVKRKLSKGKRKT
jgi:hypothetical protein